MTDKEFKRLSRSDLIEIIYEYQKQEEIHLAEIEELKAKLSAQEVKVKKAGSIAEAVAELNSIFETAQKTADQYLRKVYEANEDAELERIRIIAEAKQEAERIVSAARFKNPEAPFCGYPGQMTQQAGISNNEEK